MAPCQEIRGEVIGDFIRLAKSTFLPELVGISLRHYDPFERCLKADANFGCWPHYERPEKVPLTGTLSGKAFLEKNLEFVPDIQKSDFYTPEEKERALRQGFKSTVVLPLIWEERVIGTNQLYFSQPISLTADSRKIFWQMTDLGAKEVFLWLKDEADKKIREAMTLSNRKRALEVFLREVVILLGVERCVVYLEEGKGKVKLVQGYPWEKVHGLGQIFNLEELFYLLQAKKQERILLFKYDQPEVEFIRPLLEKNGIAGIIISPITILGEVRAYLVLDHTLNFRFSERSLVDLEDLSNSASLLLSHFYYDEEKVKRSVARVISSVRHEMMNDLLSLRLLVGPEGEAVKIVKRLGKTLDEILNLHLGVGLETTILNPVSLTKEVVGDCRRLKEAEGKEIKFSEEDYRNEFHSLLAGNESLIKKALFNLIFNGLEAVKMGEWVEVSLHFDKNNVYFKVKTPTKITGVDKRRIFDPGETSKRGLARGTGLYVVDLIADAHNGRVWLEDNESETVFILSLPFVKSLKK